MSDNDFRRIPETIVVYTTSPWESAVVHLRISAPVRKAGLRVVRGNVGDQVFPELVSEGDLVIIQRDFPRFHAAYQEVLTRSRVEGKPVVYETDDLLLEMPKDHITRKDYYGYVLGMLHAIIEADAVTASSPLLADYLGEFNPNTHVLQNYLDDQLWSFQSASENRVRDFPLVIGYMGGETHQDDLEYLSPTLVNLLKRYKGKVYARFWGGKPPEMVLNSPYVEWIAFNQDNYPEFVKFFQQPECDIFIAPLRNHLFNRCKSSIKFLEYSVHGIPGVYTSIPAYEAVIKQGVNGYLACSLEEWESFLVELIEKPDRRRQMGKKAQDTVKENWLLSEHCHEWLDVYLKVLSRETVSNPDRSKIAQILSVTKQAEEYQHELEDKIQELNIKYITTSSQLQEVLNSQSWRIIKKFQDLRLKVMPKSVSRKSKSS